MTRFVTVDGLLTEHAFLSRRVVHGLAADRRIPHRRLPGTRPLLFNLDEVESWIDNPTLTLEITELDKGGRIVKPATKTP